MKRDLQFQQDARAAHCHKLLGNACRFVIPGKLIRIKSWFWVRIQACGKEAGKQHFEAFQKIGGV